MKSLKKMPIFFFFLVAVSNISAQDFLKTYFNGNKDSLVAGATALVTMPDPTFQSNPIQVK